MYPTLFSIGSFEISSFGVMMAVGFLVAGWAAVRSFPLEGLDPEAAHRLLMWAIIGGLVGSKVWFAGEQFARGHAGLSDLFSIGGPLISRGGITWYGGLLGGAIAVLASARYHGLPLIRVMNATAPSLALGQALGRVGCFLVGDDWGTQTDKPWGIAFPHGVEPVSVPVHPTQLYEVIWLGAVSYLLWRRRGISPSLFGEYLVLAGVGRLWIEIFRRNPTLAGPLTNAQLAAVVCATLGALLWAQQRARRAGGLRTDAPA